MLKRVKKAGEAAADRRPFVVIASKYNPLYVQGMLGPARAVLKAAGACVEVVEVPGAFEIPVVAARVASCGRERLSGIICLGVILRGQTTHAQFIGESVTAALAQIQVQQQVPVIHEVLLLENEEQARVRCLSRDHNRGAEAAYTALEMARTLRSLDEWLTSAGLRAER
jgi:6,7-dimethyl-8-ribityllumazine synthase